MQEEASVVLSGPPPEVTPIHWGYLATPLGRLHVAASPDGVIAVGTAALPDDAFLADLDDALGPRTQLRFGTTPVLAAALDELAAYFAGRLQEFTVPLDWRLL